jgi:hypothetical protein
MSTKSPISEEIRLQTAQEVMYGNLDKEEKFPFDPKMRFHYVIFSEKLQRTEDGQVYSAKTSQRYTMVEPRVYQELFEGNTGNRRNYFERKGLKATILHDPYIQAELEGVKIFSKATEFTGKTLAEKLAKAKKSTDFVKKETSTLVHDGSTPEVINLPHDGSEPVIEKLVDEGIKPKKPLFGRKPKEEEVTNV